MAYHSIKNFSAALFKKPFYLAFFNIFIFFKSPLEILIRYVFEVGNYPKQIFVRTPLGLQSATAFSHHDLITLIECFGKLDYQAPKDISVVVDFGSNIGISALYFLTRNTNSKVYLFEPVPRNVERLRENLKGFESRYELKECAIGVEEGHLDFACDDTGRYGGLVKGGAQCFAEWDPKQTIQVDVVPANQVLEEILSRHESIDIVKIDVEGYENKILSHFDTEVLSSVKRIYAETLDDQKISGFSSERYGGLTRYFRA
ncbi:MAG: FkbM family methyltransferase [Nitrospinaceae bacterium]|nr:FkbM family methyltransferase [Nitrospinaceae bacterium]